MLGVLAIIGVLSVGAISGYTTTMYRHKLNKLKQDIASIISSMRTIYYGQSYFNVKNSEISWAGKHDFTQEAEKLVFFQI